jgi:hypothetical protein
LNYLEDKMKTETSPSYPMVQLFLDSLGSTYENLMQQLPSRERYDVKSALRMMGGYLNPSERKKIDAIALTVILRELQ